jgi:sugar/nucleoside kinase (ribokinase family)
MAAAKRVDTTGAGDFYAAGFMAGLCKGLTLRQCGTMGAIAAGKVIEVVGTTLSDEAWAHRMANALARGIERLARVK